MVFRTLTNIFLLGIARIYDIGGKIVRQFSLVAAEAAGAQILECHFWGNGVAAMSSESAVYVAEVYSHDYFLCLFLVEW